MKNKILALSLFVILSSTLVSCRGDKSAETQILPIRNMVDQTSYGPQSINEFYKDKQAARKPVSGTVAEGEDNSNKALAYGLESGTVSENPKWVTKFPIILSNSVLERGQDRYNIYCSPCHGYAGNNDGLVTKAAGGTIRPANIHDKDKTDLPIGKIYDVVTNGLNNWNMPGFAEQMSVQDRWAVVAYVRALQVSQKATAKDVPQSVVK
jgi:hypothetical protein